MGLSGVKYGGIVKISPESWIQKVKTPQADHLIKKILSFVMWRCILLNLVWKFSRVNLFYGAIMYKIGPSIDSPKGTPLVSSAI